GSPVWSSLPTMNLLTYIEELPDSVAGKHAFFYCTHGMTPGRCVLRGIRPLNDKGFVVLGWKDWYGSASLPGHLKPWFTDGHPDEIDLAYAEAFGAAMVRHSLACSAGDTSVVPEFPGEAVCDALYGIGHPFIFTQPGHEPPQPQFDSDGPKFKKPGEYPPLKYQSSMAYVMELEGFSMDADPNSVGREVWFDPETCIGCNRCVKACFCDNIDGSTKPPTLKNPFCEPCNFCEGVCPTGALHVKFNPPPKTEEESRAQFKAFRDILYRCEATGVFRRLTREEDIGWTTPWEVVTGHPRHKEIP
ncbi:MAG: hypothetical protein ACOX7P_06070, partial [Oscillospiraceae bacterium]